MQKIVIAVIGKPASVQSSGKRRERWKGQIRKEAKRVLAKRKDLPSEQEVELSISYYYHRETDLDTDNIIKPIQDALNGAVYLDDKQVKKVSAHGRNIYDIQDIRGAKAYLIRCFQDAFQQEEDFISITIEAYELQTRLS